MFRFVRLFGFSSAGRAWWGRCGLILRDALSRALLRMRGRIASAPQDEECYKNQQVASC